MDRRWHALAFGIFLTLALGFLSAGKPFVGYQGRLIPPQANLQKMKDGTAYQPYVRRQFVPSLVRTLDRAISPPVRTQLNRMLVAIPPLRFFLLERSAVVEQADAVDGLICLVIWLISFTIFAWTLESEVVHYIEDPKTGCRHSSAFPFLFTGFACAFVVLLLHNNFIYDPVTLACAALIIPALRRENLLVLVVLTAIFSWNRETAFLFPGLTFFYWMHKRDFRRAFLQGVLLGVVHLSISGSILYHYRHNPGWMAIYNLPEIIQAYSHNNLPQFVAAFLALAVYTWQVVRHWRILPPELKAVQWFIAPWVSMHVWWGWPMEWRVFFEIYPGMLLTIVAVWASFQKSAITRPTKTPLEPRLSV